MENKWYGLPSGGNDAFIAIFSSLIMVALCNIADH